MKNIILVLALVLLLGSSCAAFDHGSGGSFPDPSNPSDQSGSGVGFSLAPSDFSRGVTEEVNLPRK